MRWQGGGFTPDYQLRLLRRLAARYDLRREVHEVVILEGEEARLDEPLLHYNYADWQQFHRKQQIYARYEAKILAEQGVQPRPHNLVLQPAREFRRRLFTLQGWRDGIHGLRIALLLAWYYGFIPYWLLMSRQQTKTGASKVTGRLPRAAFQCSLRLKSVSMRVPHRVVFQLGVDAGRVGTCVSQRRLGDGQIVGGLVDASSEVVS